MFRSKANAYCKALEENFPEKQFEFSLNEHLDSKPRRGSFEFTLQNGDEEVQIWSGLKRGPPRKEKFPEMDDFVELFKKYLV